MGMTWLLLSAGHGPGECQLAVAGLVRILDAEVGAAGMEADVLETEDGPHGPLSVLVALRGDGVERLAAGWEGTIRWTCQSPLRKGWPRKNWFVSVTRVSQPEASQAPKQSELRFETFRASGPGGQHVNKTESAVRVTHIPSGMTAVAREERSQHRNKSLAVARLAGMIADKGIDAQRGAERDRWSRHSLLERGNAIRVYEGEGFRRIT